MTAYLGSQDQAYPQLLSSNTHTGQIETAAPDTATTEEHWKQQQLGSDLNYEICTTWEFEVRRYERDNNTTLPDNVKIAIMLNETVNRCTRNRWLKEQTARCSAHRL